MADDHLSYLEAGPLTALPPGVPIPSGVDAARSMVQGLLVHAYWLRTYGVAGERPDERQLRSAAALLRRAGELSGAQLDAPRPPELRVQVTCRDFTVLYVALLRAAGVPARARCGFGGYFEPGRWVDHWVAERWDGTRWVRDDAQLDGVQRQALGVDFDPRDEPAGRFLTGGEAWLSIRSGAVDPATCGIFDMAGDWFVVGNLVRDVAALSGAEMLPWDGWGGIPWPDEKLDVGLWDEVARLSLSDDAAAIRERYASDERLRVPATVTSHVDGEALQVASGV